MVVTSDKDRIGVPVANPYKKDGRVAVGRVARSGSLKEAIQASVSLIGGFNRVIQRGDKVLLNQTSILRILHLVPATLILLKQ